MSGPLLDTTTVLNVLDLSVDIVTGATRWRALDGLSLSIKRGEILGLVGESGAGKSLTGAAIIKLLPPRAEIVSGQILVDGIDVSSLAASEVRKLRGRKVGSVFQDPLTSLDPLFTIGDQLVETIRTHIRIGDREAKERAVDLLAEVGISNPSRRFTQYPHEFSGGMRQRVVIALALCADPKLLIADEPTTALDVSIQGQVLRLLRRLCETRQMGMLLITHDFGVIAETAHRLAVIYAGRIVEEGSAQTVMRQPLHPYSEGLVNAIPKIGMDLKRLPQIPGTMPRRRPGQSGCSFSSRCGCKLPGCDDARPELMHSRLSRVACLNPRPSEVQR